MSLNEQQIIEIKQNIDNIREYVESDLCKICEEMTNRLRQCEKLLNEYSRKPDMDYPE
jgi:hypothetical protein